MGSGGMGAGQLAPQSSASDPSEAAALPPGGGIPAGRLRTHDPQRRAEQGHPKVILAFGLVVLPGVSSLQGGGGEAKVPAAARKRAAEDRPADSTCWVAGMARSWPQALGPGPGTALPARQAQSGQAGRAQSGWLSGPFARAARASRRCSHISVSALPGQERGQGLPRGVPPTPLTSPSALAPWRAVRVVAFNGNGVYAGGTGPELQELLTDRSWRAICTRTKGEQGWREGAPCAIIHVAAGTSSTEGALSTPPTPSGK